MKPFREWKLYEHQRRALDLVTYELTVPRREVLYGVYLGIITHRDRAFGRRRFRQFSMFGRDVSALLKALRALKYVKGGYREAAFPLQLTPKGAAALWRVQ